METKCNKCGGEHLGLRTDKRGIAEYYCEDCGAGQGKVSSADLVAIINASKKPQEAEKINDAPPCRYCTEDYFFRRGRMGNQYIPIDITFCPMCGRKVHKEKDRRY